MRTKESIYNFLFNRVKVTTPIGKRTVGSKACKCGRTISANKDSCFKCAVVTTNERKV